MSLDELKERAKELGLKAGNIGKEKLIEKIRSFENDKSAISAVIEDKDLDAIETISTDTPQEEKKNLLQNLSHPLLMIQMNPLTLLLMHSQKIYLLIL